MPLDPQAAKLLQVIGERHKREIEALADALGVTPVVADTLGMVSIFTIGRIMGAAQMQEVLGQE